MRVNLSDLASSGATPRTYFVSLSLPPSVNEEWIAAFAGGLAADQEEFKVTLGGGDTTSTPGPLTLSLTAIGEGPKGRGLARSGAAPGEDIYVSGTLGDAALALALIETIGVEQALQEAPGLVARYRLPEPQVTLGPALIGLATSAIDISDGLGADLAHICETSLVGAVVEEAVIPRSEQARLCLDEHPDWSNRVYSGGDDYELLFTSVPENAGKISTLAEDLGVSLTRIGRTEEGDNPVLLAESGQKMDLRKSGWRHF